MDKWLPYVQLAGTLLSLVIVWLAASGRLGFTAGQFVQKRESDADALRRLERRVQGEHDERRRTVDDINVKLGALQVEQRGQSERLRAVDDDVKELRRRVFNGGAASV